MPSRPALSGLRSPWRFQFGIKHLLLAVTVVAVALGIWTRYFRKIIDVRQAAASDHVYDHYFGFAFEDIKARNILVITGSFRRSTRLSARLYHIRSGAVTEINGITVGRNPNCIGDGIVEDMRMTLALGDKDTSIGRVTKLGCAGHTRGAGSGGEHPNDVQATVSRTFPGKITPGRECIAYIEGDREPTVDRDATFKGFAMHNNGNYLVVTVRLH